APPPALCKDLCDPVQSAGSGKAFAASPELLRPFGICLNSPLLKKIYLLIGEKSLNAFSRFAAFFQGCDQGHANAVFTRISIESRTRKILARQNGEVLLRKEIASELGI